MGHESSTELARRVRRCAVVGYGRLQVRFLRHPKLERLGLGALKQAEHVFANLFAILPGHDRHS